MKILLCLLIICMLVSCRANNNNDSNERYDVVIKYLETPLKDKRPLKNDSLIVVFDGNFNKDTVDVYINGRYFKQMILTTDEIDGTAGSLIAIKYNKIKNIGFRINGGKLIFIEPEKEHYNFRLNYSEDTVTIQFYRLLPASM
ncbi:MAG: hypothetical protein JW870_21550 [Candidatus Delongbacteria bacterium]|nr:hypothetical protein [Candidatus Delongbacteria bacterium]